MAHDVVVADEGDPKSDFDTDSWEPRCSCGWVGARSSEAAADLAGATHRTQKFFADFAAETRRPHFGEQQAGWMRSLLLRAEEARLYDPTQEPI